jgi:transposase-like protein
MTDVIRWSTQRKQAVADAVRSGEMSVEGACERYDLSEEELSAWLVGQLYATTVRYRYAEKCYRSGIQPDPNLEARRKRVQRREGRRGTR